MKLKKFAALALAAAMTLSLAACGSKADSDLEYIKKKGTLVVGITDFAPMDYKDESGEWIGFDADMARKVAQALGVKAEFVVIDWNSKAMELQNKSIDVVWNGMTLTDEVKNSMSTSKPYALNGQVAVVAADKAGEYQTEESMKDLRFAVEDGSAGKAVVEEKGYQSVSVADQAAALMEVAAGTSDACVIDLLMAGAMIGEGTSYPNLTYTVQFNSEEYGIGFRKGSDLTDKVNELMKGFSDDGSLMEVAEVYGVQDAIIKQ